VRHPGRLGRGTLGGVDGLGRRRRRAISPTRREISRIEALEERLPQPVDGGEPAAKIHLLRDRRGIPLAVLISPPVPPMRS
jgi:hypothetical protein